jgi:CheY-like chemotaxis protein
VAKEQATRVLVVDDEPRVAEALAVGLSRMGDSYIVDTALSGDDALAKIQEEAYALILTDFQMPGMSGMDLALEVQRVSPETQIVLMTAYGTAKLREKAGRELAGYLDKPFTMDQIREVVAGAVEQASGVEPEVRPESVATDAAHRLLDSLQADSGAYSVILLSASGYAVDTAGAVDSMDVSAVGTLVAANFAAAAELARLLGRESVFKSSYHEGHGKADYNVYAYDVNGDFLLAVVFGKESKPGIVWFYTEQTAAALVPLMPDASSVANGFGDDLAEAIDAGLDQLLEGGYDGIGGGLMSIEDAIAQGLIPPELGGDE